MPDAARISEADEAALAALADGRLDAATEEALFARMAGEPALAAAFELEQRGRVAIRAAAAEVRAPESLRAALRRQA